MQVEARTARRRPRNSKTRRGVLRIQRATMRNFAGRSLPTAGTTSQGPRDRGQRIRDYLDHDLNPRIHDYNRRLIARYRRCNRIADTAFSGDPRSLRKELRNLTETIDGRIAELEGIKQREQRALKSLGEHIPQCIKSIEDWANLATKARDDARRAARDSIISLVLLDRRILFADQAERARIPLDELGETLFKGASGPQIREDYAKLLEEFRVASSKVDLVELLQKSQNLHAITSSLAEEDQGAFILSVAKCLVVNARLQLILGEVKPSRL